MDIKDFRAKLDGIDDRIAELFRERLSVVREIGLWKKSNGVPTDHAGRERAILDRILPRFDEGEKEYAEKLYLEIFRSSKELQRGLLGSYYVVGKSLPHTWSPDIYVPLGLDYRMKEFASENELKEFVSGREYSGFNVTIPYKKAVMDSLDEISEEARAIGAVNTAEYLLRTGGAKEIIKVSRKGPVDYTGVYERKDIEIILNTTPVGMFPTAEAAPVDIDGFPSLEGVFDAIYNPLRTSLVAAARARGIPTSGGLPMLAEQGRAAYNLYRGTETDISVTESLIKRIEAKKSNIVLCGMPSSGKTTVGKLVAEMTGREFYDSDEIAERTVGISIPEIFSRYGEQYFRAEEEKIIGELSALNGAVIAIGGGAAMSEVNRARLKRNGIAVLVERDNSKLDTSGRPVSQREGIEALYLKRMPVYKAFADVSVNNDGAPEDAAKAVGREILETTGLDIFIRRF